MQAVRAGAMHPEDALVGVIEAQAARIKALEEAILARGVANTIIVTEDTNP